jgi:hypothetical protein
MTEHRVDVMVKTGKVLQTYPIAIGAVNPSPKAADDERATLGAARAARLVPDSNSASLKACMHTPAQAAA